MIAVPVRPLTPLEATIDDLIDNFTWAELDQG